MVKQSDESRQGGNQQCVLPWRTRRVLVAVVVTTLVSAAVQHCLLVPASCLKTAPFVRSCEVLSAHVRVSFSVALLSLLFFIFPAAVSLFFVVALCTSFDCVCLHLFIFISFPSLFITWPKFTYVPRPGHLHDPCEYTAPTSSISNATDPRWPFDFCLFLLI